MSDRDLKEMFGNPAFYEKLPDYLKEAAGYKYALEQSCIVAITDQKGIIQEVNDNFCKISKYSREELLGKDHKIINSGYHPPEFIKELWRTIASGKIWKGELRNKAKDGTIYWVDTTIVPFLNEKGKPYRYVAIRADITERKKAEQEIKSLSYALEQSCIVAITDQKGIIKEVNDNFCRISKYSREELIGKDHRIINSGYHSSAFIKELWQTIAKGRIWRGELRNMAKDGTVYWVDTTIVPFLNEQGKPYQYIAIRADITERKKAEQEIRALNEELEQKVIKRTTQLQKANKELEAFSYSVSHDLRAPLRAVNGYAKLLEEDYSKALDAEGLRLLSEIQENARRMGALIDDLLAFSKIGRNEVKKTFIKMKELTESVLEEINNGSVYPEAKIILHPLEPVRGEYSLIKQVMVNLISNAVKYASKRKRPEIEISCRRYNDFIIYRVKDNGIGFNNKYANQLFGVFHRLHSNDEFEGTGIGLALTQRIIDKHGGKIWAEGQENKGATFYFSLPAT
jgi:PAS domain S-box-containing protein